MTENETRAAEWAANAEAHLAGKSAGSYEIAWQQFDQNDRLVTKRKSFKTEAARAKFIERISYHPAFYCIYGTRDPGSRW